MPAKQFAQQFSQKILPQSHGTRVESWLAALEFRALPYLESQLPPEPPVRKLSQYSCVLEHLFPELDLRIGVRNNQIWPY